MSKLVAPIVEQNKQKQQTEQKRCVHSGANLLAFEKG